jgi:hypothetical protein
VISYANTAVRHYEFGPDGDVLSLDDQRRCVLVLAKKEGFALLDFGGDGKLERIRVVGGRLRIEHFHPATDYPNKAVTTGVGVK